jgi:hypothetical protein
MSWRHVDASRMPGRAFLRRNYSRYIINHKSEIINYSGLFLAFYLLFSPHFCTLLNKKVFHPYKNGPGIIPNRHPMKG